MKKQTLNVGQFVYIVGKDICEPTICEVLEHTVRDNQERDIYKVKDENNKEFKISYPEDDKEELGYLILTRSEYIACLRKAKDENENKMMQMMDELEMYNTKMEYRMNKALQVCEDHPHDYGEWEEYTWHDASCISAYRTKEGIKYTVGKEINGWSRTCKCCGYLDRTTDKSLVDDSKGNKTKW